MIIVWQSFFLGVVSAFILSSLLLLLIVTLSQRSTFRSRQVAKKALVRIR